MFIYSIIYQNIIQIILVVLIFALKTACKYSAWFESVQKVDEIKQKKLTQEKTRKFSIGFYVSQKNHDEDGFFKCHFGVVGTSNAMEVLNNAWKKWYIWVFCQWGICIDLIIKWTK